MVASLDFSSLLRLLFEYLYSAPIFKGIHNCWDFGSNDPVGISPQTGRDVSHPFRFDAPKVNMVPPATPGKS